jgi:zinc transport system substrate-binding protein
MKKILLFSLASILFLYGCSTDKTADETSRDLVVAASFYPLYDFASNVVGSEGEVISITPNGTEPHDFEPTPKDLARIYSSQLFIYNGSGMDPWAEKIAADLESKGVKTLEMSQFVDLLSASHEDEHGHDEDTHDDHEAEAEEEGHEENHDHGDFDPHFWLDPVIAQTLVKEITAELQLLVPTKSSVFKENSDNFVAELETLVASYKEGLASCNLNTTVASHAAFNYLANRFGFEVISIAGISP